MHWIKNGYFLSTMLNVIIYFLSYKLGTLDKISFKNPTLYWCFFTTIITYICSFLFENNKKLTEEIGNLNSKISTLLITKDTIPNTMNISIIPDVINDIMQVNKLVKIRLVCNAAIQQNEIPTVTIESNYELFFNMPHTTISPVFHRGKFIYYFKNLDLIQNYNSKQYWEYRFYFTPKDISLYDITFTLETEQLKAVKNLKMSCN